MGELMDTRAEFEIQTGGALRHNRSGIDSVFAAVLVLVSVVLMGAGFGASAVADNRDPPPPPVDWVSEELRDHPLAGKVWSAREGGLVELRDFARELALARYVLLGEIHDNPDHHLWQAWAIRTVSKLRGSRIVEGAPQLDVIAMEMVRTDQNAALDKFYGRDVLVPRPRKPRDFARMLKWSESGWPDFKIYEPIIEQALYERLVIVPASVSREFTRKLSKEGEAALGAEDMKRLTLDEPLPQPLADALTEEIEKSHCGLMPKSAFPRMSFIQRFRDAVMADALLAVAAGKGGVLIAGNGHVRSDRGVPVYLVRRGVARENIVAVEMAEVAEGVTDPAKYVERGPDGEPAADFVIFTPRTTREDPCERMRERMGAPHARGNKEAKPADGNAGAAPKARTE